MSWWNPLSWGGAESHESNLWGGAGTSGVMGGVVNDETLFGDLNELGAGDGFLSEPGARGGGGGEPAVGHELASAARSFGDLGDGFKGW